MIRYENQTYERIYNSEREQIFKKGSLHNESRG